MVRIIISVTKIIVTAVAALLFCSCHWEINTVKGSGKVVTETRQVSEPFTGIDVDKGLEVIVEQSNDKSVVVEADDNLLKHITTNVENGILYISSDFNSYNNISAKKITVRLPDIMKLSCDGGSNLKTDGLIKGNNIFLESDGGSNMQIAIESDAIIAESESGSHMSIEGKALRLEIASSGGSSIDSQKLMVNDVDAQASGGSSLDIHAILSLNATASGGSSIIFSGKPEQVHQEESSGASVASK